ncbi:lipoyl(octanoyl) transferase LipB [Actinomycetospora sp. C-140]
MTRSSRAAAEPVEVHELGTVEYLEAWDQQRAHADARVAGTGPDVLMLLEHPSVYTAGRRTLPEERPADGTPVIDVDRGGKITWHGPGQLVGYPIIRLAEPVDVVEHVRRLEQALIAVCDTYGLAVGRIDGRSGVWLPADDRGPARKIAAIGVRVARGVTLHGFALNAEPDLAGFGAIVPCGIRDAGVTSLTAELGRRVGVDEVRDATRDAVLAALDGRLEITDRTLPAAQDTAPDAPRDVTVGGLTVRVGAAR